MKAPNVSQALRIVNAPTSAYSLEEIRAAGELLVDELFDDSTHPDPRSGTPKVRRRAVQQAIRVEHEKLIELFGEEAVAIVDLKLWEITDHDDPSGDMRLVSRGMSRKPRATWKRRQIREQLALLGHDLDDAYLRLVLKQLRAAGVVASPTWGEYRLVAHASADVHVAHGQHRANSQDG